MQLWVQDHFDGTVLLGLEEAVGFRGLVQCQVMGGQRLYAERIAGGLQEGQDFWNPAPGSSSSI